MQMKKRNLLLFVISAVAEILIGIFAFSPAVIADGVVTIAFGERELPCRPNWLRPVLYTATAVAGVGIGTWSFLNLMKNTGYYEYAPQIWALPFLVAVFIAKLFACIDASDIIDDGRGYVKSLRFAAATTCIAIIGVVGSYWIYHIEPAVGLALSAFILLTALRLLFSKK